jgi:flagellar biosynthetic protein FliR
MPQMQVYFVGVPLSIFIGFMIFAAVLASMMGTYMDYLVGVMQGLTSLN